MPGMSCSAGAGTAESGHLMPNRSPTFSSVLLCWHQPQRTRNMRIAVVTCDDTRTLKFTLIVQKMLE
jgi:hypothetical protein